MDNIVLQAIRNRRNCRSYKTQQITDEELHTVLEAGTWAATARGQQDPFIVAVQKPDEVQTLVSMNAQVMGTDDNPYYGAPTIILVFASEANKNAIADGSLVLGNMMLAAHSIGLASCWINREREMFATQQGKTLMAHYGLPEGLIGIGALAIGYAEGSLKSPKPRKEDYIKIV